MQFDNSNCITTQQLISVDEIKKQGGKVQYLSPRSFHCTLGPVQSKLLSEFGNSFGEGVPPKRLSLSTP